MTQLSHIPRRVVPELDVDSLASAIRLRGRDDPGMRFARLGIRGSKKKHAARLRAREAMTDNRLRSFLTMPGLFFCFEWMLLQKRERGNVFSNHKKRPCRTFITSIEREPGIYRGAFRFIPHLEHGYVKYLNPVPYSTSTIQTPFIFRYHHITFEDYSLLGIRQDAAFLDFNGPLTLNRLIAIERFWKLSTPMILVINRMMGRSPDGWSDPECHNRIMECCSDRRLVDDFKYDGFRQIVLSR